MLGRQRAISSTLRAVEEQHASIMERIARAESLGDYEESRRLRIVADSCRDAAGRYRSELAVLTQQHALPLEV